MASIVERYEELLQAARAAEEAWVAEREAEGDIIPMLPREVLMQQAELPEVVTFYRWVEALPEEACRLLDRVASFGACSTDRPRIQHCLCKAATLAQFQTGMSKAIDAEWDLSEILWQAEE